MSTPSIRTDFFQGRAGRLFSLCFEPAGVPSRGWILHLPAFAEEMNKARRQVALQARAMAVDGWRVLIPDLYGTGDSEGEFRAGDWSLWREDIMALCASQQNHGQPVLWGLRVGALMARAVLDHLPARGLICWQPVLRGDQFLNQFLRLRLAASMLGGQTQRQSMADLRQELEQQGVLEVAGYELDRGVFDALQAAALAPPKEPIRTLWCEVFNNPGRDISPASRKLLDGWPDAERTLQVETIQAQPFWSTQEIYTSQALIETTCTALRRWSDAA